MPPPVSFPPTPDTFCTDYNVPDTFCNDYNVQDPF